MTEFEKAVDLEIYIKENWYEIYWKTWDKYFVKKKIKEWNSWNKHMVVCSEDIWEDFLNKAWKKMR